MGLLRVPRPDQGFGDPRVVSVEGSQDLPNVRELGGGQLFVIVEPARGEQQRKDDGAALFAGVDPQGTADGLDDLDGARSRSCLLYTSRCV